MIIKKYEGLFPKSKIKEEDQRYSLFRGPVKIEAKFRWHNMIYNFIKELNMKQDEVYKMNYISALNWLSYFKNRDEVQQNLNKKNKNG